MSYALAFTADARYDFAELPVSLQELVLDEWDQVTALISLPPGTFVRDVSHDTAVERHYAFMHLALDRPHNAVLVLGIHYHTRRFG